MKVKSTHPLGFTQVYQTQPTLLAWDEAHTQLCMRVRPSTLVHTYEYGPTCRFAHLLNSFLDWASILGRCCCTPFRNSDHRSIILNMMIVLPCERLCVNLHGWEWFFKFIQCVTVPKKKKKKSCVGRWTTQAFQWAPKISPNKWTMLPPSSQFTHTTHQDSVSLPISLIYFAWVAHASENRKRMTLVRIGRTGRKKQKKQRERKTYLDYAYLFYLNKNYTLKMERRGNSINATPVSFPRLNSVALTRKIKIGRALTKKIGRALTSKLGFM